MCPAGVQTTKQEATNHSRFYMLRISNYFLVSYEFLETNIVVSSICCLVKKSRTNFLIKFAAMAHLERLSRQPITERNTFHQIGGRFLEMRMKSLQEKMDTIRLKINKL